MILWILLIISLIVDLLLVVVKASYTHARLPYLLNLREGREELIEKAVRLLEQPRLHIGLNFALTLLHLFLAGILVNILLSGFPELGIGLLLVYLLI